MYADSRRRTLTGPTWYLPPRCWCRRIRSGRSSNDARRAASASSWAAPTLLLLSKNCLRLITSFSAKLKRRCRNSLKTSPAAKPNDRIRQPSGRRSPPRLWPTFIWRILSVTARCRCSTRVVVPSHASSATSSRFTGACRALRAISRCSPNLTRCAISTGAAPSSSLITESSVNLADDEPLLDSMRDAGFRRVFLGIETPVEESLKEAQKSQNRGNLLDSVKKIQSYGMEVMAGFIVGFDNDPADIFQRQIDFIRKSAIPLAMVGLLNALPDTQLWKLLEL